MKLEAKEIELFRENKKAFLLWTFFISLNQKKIFVKGSKETFLSKSEYRYALAHLNFKGFIKKTGSFLGTEIEILETKEQWLDKKNKEKEKEKEKSFKPPTLEEVQNYCSERKNSLSARQFIDFYTAKNWFIGKNKMKDWKAAIRTWEISKKNSQNPEEKKKQELEDFRMELRKQDEKRRNV